MKLGLIVTKKELAIYLGLHSPTGYVYTERLREVFFTDEVLQKMNLTPMQYKKKRGFTLHESNIIHSYIKNSYSDTEKDSAQRGDRGERRQSRNRSV